MYLVQNWSVSKFLGDVNVFTSLCVPVPQKSVICVR